MKRNSQIFLWAVAGLYGASMLFLLLFREIDLSPAPYLIKLRQHLNPHPLHTIQLYLRCFLPPFRPGHIQQAVINLLGNILLFIPLGLLPPLLWQKMRRWWKVVLLALGIMTTVELLQMFLLVGTCDVDDLLLNTLGAAIGYGLYRWIAKE